MGAGIGSASNIGPGFSLPPPGMGPAAGTADTACGANPVTGWGTTIPVVVPPTAPGRESGIRPEWRLDRTGRQQSLLASPTETRDVHLITSAGEVAE